MSTQIPHQAHTAQNLSASSGNGCSDCAGIDREVLRSLRRWQRAGFAQAERVVHIGRVTIHQDGLIAPPELMDEIAPRERELLTILALSYPLATPWGQLFPLKWQDGPSERSAIRTYMGRLRAKLLPYGITVGATGKGACNPYGYVVRLVENSNAP